MFKYTCTLIISVDRALYVDDHIFYRIFTLYTNNYKDIDFELGNTGI